MVVNKFLFSLSFSLLSFPVLACKPISLYPLADFDIIAHNTADIPTKQAFKGENISYSLEAKPHHKKNKVSIDPREGLIKITASAEDQFDVTVKAKNQCGFTKLTFNVQISEEE